MYHWEIVRIIIIIIINKVRKIPDKIYKYATKTKYI